MKHGSSATHIRFVTLTGHQSRHPDSEHSETASHGSAAPFPTPGHHDQILSTPTSRSRHSYGLTNLPARGSRERGRDKAGTAYTSPIRRPAVLVRPSAGLNQRTSPASGWPYLMTRMRAAPSLARGGWHSLASRSQHSLTPMVTPLLGARSISFRPASFGLRRENRRDAFVRRPGLSRSEVGLPGAAHRTPVSRETGRSVEPHQRPAPRPLTVCRLPSLSSPLTSDVSLRTVKPS